MTLKLYEGMLMKELTKEIIKHAVVIAVVIIVMYSITILINQIGLKSLVKVSYSLLFFITLALIASALSSISESNYVSKRVSKVLGIGGVTVNVIGLIFLLKTFPYDELYIGDLKKFVDDTIILVVGTGVIKVGGVLLGIVTPIFNSAGGFLVFYGLSRILLKVPEKLVNSLSLAVFYTGIIFSILTLITLMAFSKNRNIAELGRYVGERTGAYTFYSFLVTFYLFSFRDILMGYASFLREYIPLIEIGFVSFFVLMIADGIYTHFNKEKIILVHVVNKWKLHKPNVVSFEETWLKELESSIDAFIIYGDATSLALKLAYVLAKYNVLFENVEKVLEPLTSYSEREVPIIAFRWHKRKIHRELMEERVNIVSEVIERVRELVK